MTKRVFISLMLLLAILLATHWQHAHSAKINPALWPELSPAIAHDEALERQVQQWLERLTLAEKVGQLIQADLGSVTPDQVRRFNLGSILNSGETGPGGNPRAPAPLWLELADEFWAASTDGRGGRAAIPMLWGTDAVHGHNNVIGATIFPHNIGLGAADDPALVEAVGQATAKEMRVTGQDWTFAPTVAIARNDRWGRTYEAYSEQPERVAGLGAAMVRGLQGEVSSEDFLRAPHVIATAKHFIGDGGTVDGLDQGDNRMSETQLRDLQLAGYTGALEAGVQTVMASFNSWHGQRLHGLSRCLRMCCAAG